MIIDVFGPGTVVNGFRVESLAGRGGSSLVYRAVEVSSGRPVALKILTAPDQSSRRRLVREAQLLADVHHPGIVPFRGLQQMDGHDVLITDWVDGQSLRRHGEDGGTIPVERALALLWELAEALDHLHGLGIVHRDITPANVIIGPDGSPTLIDLGIGHHVDSATMTGEDLLAGTPQYLAPEVIRGEAATGRSDQYSVGALLHELLTGRSPFPDADRVATALHHQLHTVPEPLDEVDPSIPSHVADAILRSLQKDPEQRFESMHHFARVASGADPAANDRQRRNRRTIGLTGLAAVVVGVAAVFAAVTVFSGDKPTADSTTDVVAAGADPDSDSEAPLVIEVDAQTSDTQTGGSAEPSASESVEQPVEGEQSGESQAEWAVGTAGVAACNLLQGSTFGDGSLPLDYFGEPAGRERVVAEVGYGGSSGLEVGRAGAFGQFGEVVAVQPGEEYLFSGWVRTVGDVAEAQVGISFLTTDYGPLSTGAQAPVTASDGRFIELSAAVPEGAGFAVPYLFKDSSTGVVVADELVFGRADLCRAEFTVPAP